MTTTSDRFIPLEDFAPDMVLSPAEQAECDAREASGYWDIIESGRYEVEYATEVQQQGPHYTGAFDTIDAAEAEATVLRDRGLYRVFVKPVHVYRGNGEAVS